MSDDALSCSPFREWDLTSVSAKIAPSPDEDAGDRVTRFSLSPPSFDGHSAAALAAPVCSASSERPRRVQKADFWDGDEIFYFHARALRGQRVC